jgi:hypothetical protein
MKKPTIHQLWGVLCAVLILTACQKETSTTQEQQSSENNLTRTSGVMPDDPAKVAKVPLIVSAEFFNSPNALGAKGGGKGGKQTDSDGDSITDANDACPTQKETVNGYQDTDGCPDTAPPPTPTDGDGDGIADTSDGCPTQKETFNGYQDSDGCPDTVPDSDADGIVDTQDGCPTEKETVNGYQDTDGCPDTPPTVIDTPATLPASYRLNMPPVQNQGGEGSCVPFATTYAARSVEQYYKTGASGYSYSTNVFSPEFVYNQIKTSDCGSGTGVINALDFLKSTGVCSWQSMPYSSSNGCSLLPTSSQTAEAANYKISSYSKLAVTDITAIKTMLVNRHAVIITVGTDNSFTQATPGFIWKNYSGAMGISHCLVISGYDDAKHAYQVMSSWGTGWGESGFSWIDYDFLPQCSAYYGYAIN